MDSHILREELRFAQNSYNGLQGEPVPYTVMEGNIPIVVSAPHSVNHYREHKLKYADMYTGAIALALHSLTRCHCIIATRLSSEDPNYILGGQYKEALRELVETRGVRFVLDLHGASEKRPFDVDLGSLSGASMDEEYRRGIIDIFKRNGVEGVVENHTFSAGHPGTITSFAANELNVQGIQMEINRSYRDPEDDERLHRMLESLRQVIAYLRRVSMNGS